MLPELERGRTDEAGRARLKAALEVGPWCWPSSPLTEAFELATRVTGQSSPPEPHHGVIPGPTVEGHCAFLWLIDARGGGDDGDATLDASCRRAWRSATSALPSAVPLLWTSVSALQATTPRLRQLTTYVDGLGIAPPCRLVRGPSFGLSFLLAAASQLFRLALPGDLIASAEIRDDGRIDTVDGLHLKLAAVMARMPGVRRVMVAAEQVHEAEQAVSGHLKIIGVARSSQALEIVFGDHIAEPLLRDGTDPARRAELASWFFRFSLLGRGELVDWSPVAYAAALALDRWPNLTAEQRFQLGFAQGVAERHEWNGGTLPVPPKDWLRNRPLGLRAHLVAHMVQQAADAGQPPWSEIEPLIEMVRQSDMREAHPMQLRVEGALARLLAVTGRPHEALELQERLATVHFESLLYNDVSFPLSEWYRLSGACHDTAAFARAEEMRVRVDAAGGLSSTGGIYVELSRCKARSFLEPGAADLIETLRALMHDHRGPAHLRWAAARHILRQPADSIDPAFRASVLDELMRAIEAPGTSGHAAAVDEVLVRLDAAVAAADQDAAHSALHKLAKYQAAIVEHLVKAAQAAKKDVGYYVALCYPY